MTTSLFVFHETGRTMSIFAIVDSIIKRSPTQDMTFLLVGEAARKVFAELVAQGKLTPSSLIKIIDLANYFSPQEVEFMEDHPLHPEQLDNIKREFLDEMDITHVIIGAPSWHGAMAPFQIAEDIAARLSPKRAFIYDGDFYLEEDCVYWRVLRQPFNPIYDWRERYTWLASLPVSRDHLIQVNPALINNVKVVGDPSIDTAIKEKPMAKDKVVKIRADLEVKVGQELLFVSGTKNSKDDADLVMQLLQERLPDAMQIRIVLHPGVRKPNEHITAYLNLFATYDPANVKIIVSDRSIANKYILNLSHSREVMAAVADRLACSIPGTQATRAAIDGIPTYTHLTQYQPYLNTRIETGPEQLDAFLASNRTRRKTLTKKEMGLPPEDTIELVGKLLAPQKSNYIKYGIFAASAVVGMACLYKAFATSKPLRP